MILVALFALIAVAPSPLKKIEPKTVALKIPAATVQADAVPIETPKPAEPKPFDVNDRSTWPVCPDNQIVWAQDGTCHEKPAEAAPVAQAEVSAPVATVSGLGSPIYNCAGADNFHGMQYIFCHESGSIPNRTNGEGCVGLGQACPASKLYNVCPNLDVDCQISFFANYAAQRYGGWGGAESFWRANRWW